MRDLRVGEKCFNLEFYRMPCAIPLGSWVSLSHKGDLNIEGRNLSLDATEAPSVVFFGSGTMLNNVVLVVQKELSRMCVLGGPYLRLPLISAGRNLRTSRFC